MFAPGKLFQPRLMFVGKARSLPLSGVLGWKGLARDKHSSLLRILLNYRRKKFSNIGPRPLSIATLPQRLGCRYYNYDYIYFNYIYNNNNIIIIIIIIRGCFTTDCVVELSETRVFCSIVY